MLAWNTKLLDGIILNDFVLFTFFRGIAADGVLALFHFWRGYKTPLFRVLRSTMCCGGAGGLKVIMTSSETFRPTLRTQKFHEKPRAGDIERKGDPGQTARGLGDELLMWLR